MPTNEDYLDGLLDSINKTRNDTTGGGSSGRERRQDRLARRSRLSEDDDFMEANGLSDYIPRRIGRDNLRRALTENDFVREFEEELLSGDADDFIDEFERELDFGEDGGDTADPWEITDSPRRDASGKKASEETVISSDDDDYFKDPSLEEASSEPVSASSPASAPEAYDEIPLSESAPEGMEFDPEDTSLLAEASRESGEPDALLSNIESILEDAKKDTENSDLTGASTEAIGEDFLQPEFEPDELDMSMLNPDGSAVEVPLMDENIDEADLMAALAGGDGELMDIGDLLNADESGEELGEARDMFEASAENVAEGGDGITDVSFDGANVEEDGEKKPGFLQKILGIFAGLGKKKDKSEKEEEDDGATETGDILDIGSSDPTAAELADESADILAGFADDEGATAGASEAEDPKKAKKEKKKKEKKEKKEKKPKEPKPKKEKKEKPKDNSPKIPLKVIIGFLLLAVSLVILVKVATNIYADRIIYSSAESLYDSGNYLAAYSTLNGAAIDEDDEDMVIMMQNAKLLAPLQMKYREYEVAMGDHDYEKALDSLIVGSMYYRRNLSKASEYGITNQYNQLGAALEQQLLDQFGLEEADAIEIFELPKREDYTIEIKNILEERGFESEDRWHGGNN